MFRDSFWGQNGFDELRRYVKQGNQFSSEVFAIMQERSDLETTYAKGLQKLSAKLSKAATGCLGTLASAWGMAASEMETEAELHKSLAAALFEDIYKPLKSMVEAQNKTRKPIEAMVDKASKTLHDRRNDDVKMKKTSFGAAKEREKLREQISSARTGKNKPISDKDLQKLEKKARQMDDSVRKADRDYHDTCLKAESARQEWESSIYKASTQLQVLEEERISQMQDLLNKYNSHVSVMGPKLVQSCERLAEAVLSIDTSSDLRTAVDSRGTGPNQPEQILMDYYAEDFSQNMDGVWRKQCLQNYAILLQQDLDREKKGREGVEKLVEVYKNRPTFADADAQEDARARLSHYLRVSVLVLTKVTATINFLEANQFKVNRAVCQAESRQEPTYAHAQFIKSNKDKQDSKGRGLTSSVLCLPLSVLSQALGDVTNAARGPADGSHADNLYDGGSSAPPPPYGFAVGGAAVGGATGDVSTRPKTLANGGGRRQAPATPVAAAPPMYSPPFSHEDDDEFDHYPENTVLCRCQVIYDYSAAQYDELTIRQGDILNVYEKQADGWWHGELGGNVGIFPATYVQELT